jgi:hypothetical protein
MYASRVGCRGSACGGTSRFGRSSCSEALPLDVAKGSVGLPEDTGGGFSRGSVEPEASTSLAVGATMSVGTRSEFHGVLFSHVVDLPEQQPPPPFLGFAMLRPIRVPDLLAGCKFQFAYTDPNAVRGQVAVVVRAGFMVPVGIVGGMVRGVRTVEGRRVLCQSALRAISQSSVLDSSMQRTFDPVLNLVSMTTAIRVERALMLSAIPY